MPHAPGGTKLRSTERSFGASSNRTHSTNVFPRSAHPRRESREVDPAQLEASRSVGRSLQLRVYRIRLACAAVDRLRKYARTSSWHRSAEPEFQHQGRAGISTCASH